MKSAALILDAPFTSTADVGAAAYPFVPVRWLMKDTFRSDERIGRVIGAALGAARRSRTASCPIRFGEKLFALAREPKRFVRFPQGGHVNLDDFGAAKVVKEFLRKACQPAVVSRPRMPTQMPLQSKVLLDNSTNMID